MAVTARESSKGRSGDAGGGNPDTDELVTESLVEPVDPREVAELFERQADGR